MHIHTIVCISLICVPDTRLQKICISLICVPDTRLRYPCTGYVPVPGTRVSVLVYPGTTVWEPCISTVPVPCYRYAYPATRVHANVSMPGTCILPGVCILDAQEKIIVKIYCHRYCMQNGGENLVCTRYELGLLPSSSCHLPRVGTYRPMPDHTFTQGTYAYA